MTLFGLLTDEFAAYGLLSLVCGAAAGFALGMIGGGGSILATPMLLYVVGVKDPHIAIGTSAVAVCAAALFNFVIHAKAGNVRWSSAIVFAIVGVAGALVGSNLGKAFDGQKLLALFGVLMLIVGALMLRSRDAHDAPAYEGRSDGLVAGLALPAGMASGFFGIGGGFLIVPCLLYATRMPMIDAVGSSLLAVASFSVATAANYAHSGLVAWPVAAWFIVGGLVGGFAGMRCAGRLCRQKQRLRQVFSVVVFVVAVYILYRSIGNLSAV